MFPVARTILKFAWEELRRLPILRCLVPFAIGIVACRSVETSLFLIAAGTLVSAALLLLYNWNRKRAGDRWSANVSNIAIVLSFVVFGMAYGQMRCAIIVKESGRAQLYGYVKERVKETEGFIKLCVHADSLIVGGKKYVDIDGTVRLENTGSDVFPGRDIEGEVRVWSSDQRIFSSFDNETWMMGKNYSFVSSADSISYGQEMRWSVVTVVSKLREKAGSRLMESGLSAKNVSIVMALLMGDRSRLDDHLKKAFTDCGIVHILAVSGLHVGLVYGLIVLALGKVREKRPWLCWGVGLMTLWGYAIICGMAPSVARAAIMMTVIETGRVLCKQKEMMNTLYVAVFVILLINPMDIYSIGLYLSFMAVWGIFNLYLPIRNRIGDHRWRIVNYVSDSVLLSFSAQAATMPISLYYFHRFPVYFLVHNVLLIWMVGPVISLSILAIVCGGAIPVGGIVDIVLSKFCEYVEWASLWPCSVIENIPFGMMECVSTIILLYVIGWAIGERWVYWKVARLRLTIVFCVFMVAFSCLASGIYHNRKKALVVCETLGNPSVHVVERGQSIHVLSDTMDVGEVRIAEEVDNYYHVSNSETYLMMDGMEIETPWGIMIVVDSEDKMKVAVESGCEMIMVTGNIGPRDSGAEKILLSSRTQMKMDWMESGQAGKCEFLGGEPWVMEKGWIEEMMSEAKYR